MTERGDKMLNNKYRIKLREIRKKRNLTQQQVADNLGIKRNTYTQYETGVSTPSFEVMLKIKSLLKYFKDDLFFITDVTNSDDKKHDVPA